MWGFITDFWMRVLPTIHPHLPPLSCSISSCSCFLTIFDCLLRDIFLLFFLSVQTFYSHFFLFWQCILCLFDDNSSGNLARSQGLHKYYFWIFQLHLKLINSGNLWLPQNDLLHCLFLFLPIKLRTCITVLNIYRKY